MGKWYDEDSEEESKQKAAEARRKVQANFRKFEDGLESDSAREEEWNRILNHCLTNPHTLHVVPDTKLNSHLIEAEGRVELLKRKGSRLGDRQESIRSIAPPKFSAIFDAITGVGTSVLDEQIRKHEQLITLIEAEKERRKTTKPEESAEDKAVREAAEEMRQANAIVSRLEEERDKAIRENPGRKEAITRLYGKKIDAVLEKL